VTETSGIESRTLQVAEQVCEVLERLGIESAVIGAMALAVHGYVRATRHFDLAMCADPFVKLVELQRALDEAGFHAELRQPHADDPLGGVVEITGEGFKPIQIVNFLNPLSPRAIALGSEAIRESKAGLVEQSRMRVVGLPCLIALKLYGGGPKNKNDVIELLERNQPLDLSPIREVCARHGLGQELESILAGLGL
jgi:hypothetical protein